MRQQKQLNKQSNCIVVVILLLVLSVHCSGYELNIQEQNVGDAQLINLQNTQAQNLRKLSDVVLDETSNDEIIPNENESTLPVADPECQRDQDCGYLETCNIDSMVCERKSLFPMTLSELLGSVAILLVVGVGQAAGIGGGLVVVPLLMSFFGYETKKSIALVFVTIFSASLGNLTSLLKSKDKDGGPSIDYKIVLLSLPTIMIGSVYGVALNKFLPQAAVSFMLIFFILQSMTKTYRSYKRQKSKEQSEKQQASEHGSPLQTMNSPNIQFLQNQTNNNKKQEQYPLYLIKQIICITAGFAIFSLVRGGSKFESLIGIPPCGFAYQLVNAMALYAAYVLVKSIVSSLAKESQQEESLLGENLNPTGELKLSEENMKGLAVQAFLAGLIGSIVGLGGGMVLVPKWLELGIPSQKTTSCSITLLFLTAFNSVIQFGLSGVFQTDEIIYFSVIALLSSFLVSASIQDYVSRTNQNSLLILIIVIFMIIALTLFGTMTYETAMTDLDSLFKFGEFC